MSTESKLPKSQPPKSQPPTIVLVDDNPTNLATAESFLRSKGFVVFATSSPFGVTAAVQRLNPDVIVLDVMMPALGGQDLGVIIRKVSRLPIVFFSAMQEEALRDLAGRIDNATYVLKSEGLSYLALHVARCQRQKSLCGQNPTT